MTTKTLGTVGTTTLVAVNYQKSLLAADVASIQQNILNDLNVAHPVWPGAFSLQGQLFIPNRGVLQVLPGDWVAYDPATGWPILLSSRAAAGASWTHS